MSNVIQVSAAHVHVMREDPMILAIVGVDDLGNVKVFEGVARTDTKPPYVVIQQVPTLADTGVYGDDYVVMMTEFQVASWGRSPDEARRLADACHDALRTGHWLVDPWSLMKVYRLGVPVLAPDRDTDLLQVQVRYRAMFGR